MSEPLPDTAFDPSSDPLLDAGLAAGFGHDSSAPKAPSTVPIALREQPDDTPVAPTPTTEPPSGTAGRNLLFGEIARGGMGAVMRGRDPQLGRELAVKVLLEKHKDNPELIGRFLEEAQIAGQLQHPGVVPVYELGHFDDNRPFFTMKLVKGQTLAMLLSKRANPHDDLPRFLTIFEQICQTVAYAHARGVIHRDLTQKNVMVGAFGEVQVMDWGLAKVLSRGGAEGVTPTTTPELTRIRAVQSGSTADGPRAGTLYGMGTFGYMPPEQALGEADQIDERADVFALGAILCVILTGEPPYVGSEAEMKRQTARGDLSEAFVRLEVCGTDAELIRLCKECLAPDKKDRPRNAGAVAAQVAAYQAGVQHRLRQAELDRATAQARAAEERKRRRVTVALATAVLALVVLGGGGAWAWQLQRAELRQGVEAALAKAVELRQQARWPEARAVLEQAANRLGANGPTDLRQRIEQGHADLELVNSLEAIRLKRATVVDGNIDYAGADRDYVALFREKGLGEPGEDAEAVASGLRNVAVAEQLLAALDDWAGATRDAERREWLLAVARKVDDDEGRNRLRDPVAWRDPAVMKARAAATNLEELSPALIFALASRMKPEDRIPWLLAAQERHPADFWFNFVLGNTLSSAQRPDDAVGYYRAALAVRPGTPVVYNNLGIALAEKGRLDEAIAAFQKAIDLDPKLALAHNNLGVALTAKGRLGEAIAAYQEAIDLDPKNAKAHSNLGNALTAKDQLDEAIAAYQKAIALDPKLAEVHTNLGVALRAKGRLGEAIAACQKAIDLDPKFAIAHYNLGVALTAKGRLDEAIAAYQKAIDLDPKNAEAHCNLGGTLRRQGKFPDALAALRRGHELGSKQAGWRYPSAQWVRAAERMVELDHKLAAILEGKEKPDDAAERLALARLCQEPFKKLYTASSHFYAEAFANDAKIADNPLNGHRYNAACAAALAGCGQGKDADNLDDKERTRLRKQALDWLRAALALWAKQAEGDDAKVREMVQKTLKHWQADTDFASVRGKEALEKLPEAERAEWGKLWDDVAALRKKAEGQK